MVKEINEDWAKEILRGNNSMQSNNESEQKAVEFIRNNNGFKKELVFKAVPFNSKENKIFCHIVGTHWMTDSLGNSVRFVCPETTQHLKHQGVTCPICEAKRKLIAEGFKEEELCVQGKFGPVPVFDPKITSNLKVVVISSDTAAEWDKCHISVLQQNSELLTKWMVREYKSEDNPNFLAWDRSNVFYFTRPSENAKWERKLGFKTFEPTPEVIDKLKAENEELTMFDLWKMPSDEDFLKMAGILETMCDDYRKAKNTVVNGGSIAKDATEDDIPF